MNSLAATSRIPAAALALGLAGVLPFVLAAASQWFAVPQMDQGRSLLAGLTYGAVILSFLGGIRWGTAIGPYGEKRQALEFTLSVLPSLAAWLALLLPAILGLCLLIAGFLMQALWDVTSVEAGRLPHWFGKLRMILTAGAVISIIAMLARQLI